MNDDANENNGDGYRMNNEKTTNSKFFEYKANIMGNTLLDNKRLETEVNVSLKYLSNFWRSIDFVLINYEIELDLTW